MFFNFATDVKTTGDSALKIFDKGVKWASLGWDLYRYTADFTQRTLLMANLLRRRGNQYFEYQEAGQPPLTPFALETILDGRELERPVNRLLVRVMDRRTLETGRRSELGDQTKRPIIFQDPDAGRGLISASRDTSEIGLSIDTGHPTFLILVLPETVRNQTIDDLIAATRIFTQKVMEVCPHEKPPAFIGNCQAGWQMALSSSTPAGLPGPIVPVGAPLSYWSRGAKSNSLRYTGGICLGTWLPLFLGDIGDGIIDGLPPLNFELFDIDRHPILDSLKWLQEVDDERKISVFLTQQKWVYGFHQIEARQFYWVIRELFIGNRLERGLASLDREPLDMRRIKEAIIFTSYGDTITPVAQGIGWIPRVWSTTDEMKRAGVKIALIHHERAGHLAIFVSAKVADKEHRQILGVLGDDFDTLAPGLYRMELTETGDHPTRYTTTFHEIDVEEIRASLDDSDRLHFHRMAVVSEVFDRLYRITARPLVKIMSNPISADLLHRLHPMRFRVSAWADRRNPLALFIKTSADAIRKYRVAMDRENLFFKMESFNRNLLGIGLEFFKETRDSAYALIFNSLYGDGNPLMKLHLPASLFSDDKVDPSQVALQQFPSLFRDIPETLKVKPETLLCRLQNPWIKGLSLDPESPFLPSPELWKQWMQPAFFAGGMKGTWPWPIFDLDRIPVPDWSPLVKLMGVTADSFQPLMADINRWSSQLGLNFDSRKWMPPSLSDSISPE